jgi:peptidoglycan/LPS O-acetylase OafA/YrhL
MTATNLVNAPPGDSTSPRWINPRLASRIPELDGIRGLAILLVLVLHYFVELTIPYVKAGWQIKSLLLLQLSWSGVDLFFVLSGFLIGGILLDAKFADSYYRTFYLRRFYRIVPVYFLLIAAYVIGAYCLPSATKPLGELFDRQIPLWPYPLFLQNLFMTWHQGYGSGWLGVTWSLAVEEQFYLLLPFVVRRLSRRGILAFAIGMIVMAPVLRIVLERHGASGMAIYTLLPCRADALGFGLLVAIVCRNKTAWEWLTSHRRYVYTALAVLGSGLLVWVMRDFPLGFTWMAALYASLLILVVVTPGPVARLVFRSFALTKLGAVAYFVYLFHPGILRLYHYWFFGAAPRVLDWPTWWVTLLSLGTVLLLSAISWRLLEKPLIKRARSRFQYN